MTTYRSLVIVTVFMLTIPHLGFSTSEVEIPTSIQVVDERGRTQISTGSPVRRTEERGVSFVIPEQCTTFIAQSPALPTNIPSDHTLRTRLESQLFSYYSLVSQISFAPHLPDATEVLLKERLRVLGGAISPTTTDTFVCLRLLNTAFVAQGGKDQRDVLGRLSAVLSGIQYGLTLVAVSTTTLPQTPEQALYAGDLLLSENYQILSVVIDRERVQFSLLVPIHIFGRWTATATARIVADEQRTTMTVPWWTKLGTSPVADIRKRLQKIPAQDVGVEGMFLRAKEIISILYP